MLQNATPLRKSAPSPPNSSGEHVSCTAPARENASLQILFKCPTPAVVFEFAIKPSRFFTFDKVRNPLRLPRGTTSERPKVVRFLCVFNILTSKCASRHNGVHFFRHLNFQKWSECKVQLPFSLANVLRATTMCTFSTSHLLEVVRSWGVLYKMSFVPQQRALFRHLNFQRVVRSWCVLYILTWKCASRHNGVHFFDISISKSGSNVRCF